MKILLLGSTGLVGSHVLQQALQHKKMTQVIAPVRSLLNITHPKLKTIVMDFDDLPQDKDFWAVDAVICALGSTMQKAGSKQAFRKVDYGYPLEFAKMAKQHGVKTYVLNSALGANAHSLIFYNRVKGELENALKDLNFDSLTLVRPGLIEGHRQEQRTAEQLFLKITHAVQFILPAALHSNPAENIATALLNAAIEQPQGVHIISSKALV